MTAAFVCRQRLHPYSWCLRAAGQRAHLTWRTGKIFPLFGDLELPGSFFAIDGVEFYGRVTVMKASIFYSDRVTTVNCRYAWGIQTAARNIEVYRSVRPVAAAGRQVQRDRGWRG